MVSSIQPTTSLRGALDQTQSTSVGNKRVEQNAESTFKYPPQPLNAEKTLTQTSDIARTVDKSLQDALGDLDINNVHQFKEKFAETLKNWNDKEINIYKFMTSDVLESFLKDPDISQNRQFQEAYNDYQEQEGIAASSRDGIVGKINLKELTDNYPLGEILKKDDKLEKFKEQVKVLAENNKTTNDKDNRFDHFMLPGVNFKVIQTPGFGNCAFDAVLLSWFNKKGVYTPEANAVLGQYLESVVGNFRKEIADEIPDGTKLKQDAQQDRAYVDDSIFPYIAKNLSKEIILVSHDGAAQYIDRQGGVNQVLDVNETNSLIKIHKDALLICHNGNDHFAALEISQQK